MFIIILKIIAFAFKKYTKKNYFMVWNHKTEWKNIYKENIAEALYKINDFGAEA